MEIRRGLFTLSVAWEDARDCSQTSELTKIISTRFTLTVTVLQRQSRHR